MRSCSSFDLLEGLSRLRVFLTVAETGSISRAARQVFKAPSAVTRAVGELEALLGVPLFERKPRGMLLTRYGEVAQGRGCRVQDEIRAAMSEFGRNRSEEMAVASILFSGQKLRLFVAITELRNVSMVAARAGLSQSGVSMALSRMEAALGQPLFHRMSQGMVATDAASGMLKHAKRIIAELRHLQSDLSAVAGTLSGDVSVGVLPLGRTLVVPRGIAAALTQYPFIHVSTVESPYESLITGLLNGDIDFVFGALRDNEPARGLVAEPLFNARLGILARAGHPLGGRQQLSLKDLLSQRWVLPRPEAPGRHLVDSVFRQAGLEPPIPAVETGDLAMVRGLLFDSDMLTAISPPQMHYELGSGALVELPVELGNTERRIGLSMRDNAQLSPAARAVMEAVRTAAQVAR